METRFDSPLGQFQLKRLPKRRRELLRAWDNADAYLLKTVAEEVKPAAGARILVVNDSFGALAVPLAGFKPQAWSDSYLSQAATRMNLSANVLDPDSVTLHTSLDEPEGPLDLVLIKIPKTLALLEDQLIRLRPHVTADTRVLASAMAKNLPASARGLFERIIGPTESSLTWKKARLLSATVAPDLVVPTNRYPVTYKLEGTDYQLTNHANVFSRDSLDIGTRLFLKHLPVNEAAADIIDLGCGNGVVGLIAAERNPQARLHFIDESFQALASAETNFRAAFGSEREAVFRAGDSLEGFESDSADLVLCNPPFHQQTAVGDQIATRMFSQSRRVLRQGGELWVVGNRHLGYHQSLKRLFGNARVVASNAKFVVLVASNNKAK